MISANELQLVLVTPERILLDEPVRGLQFPLFDGQIGILPGRAPMVGRLGYGELKITTAGGEKSYYVDGGFVQVKESVVSILTNRSITSDEIDGAAARKQLERANERVATSDAEFSDKARDQQRARQMLSLAARRRT